MLQADFPATHQATEPTHPGALSAPQISRAAIRFGEKVAMEAEARFTPLGLLAIGGMVAAIIMSVPTMARARRANKSPTD
jgi:hypothetical protein